MRGVGCGVGGVGCGMRGAGFWVWGVGCGVWGLGSGFEGLAFGVHLVFGVGGSALRPEGKGSGLMGSSLVL